MLTCGSPHANESGVVDETCIVGGVVEKISDVVDDVVEDISGVVNGAVDIHARPP